MENVNVTSYKKVCEKEGLEFVEIVSEKRELTENEFYALMVTDFKNQFKSPHVIGIDLEYYHYIVGIERPNKNSGCYLSKDYYLRKNNSRGYTIIVKTDNPNNFTILN